MSNAHSISWSLMTDTAQVRVGDVVSADAGGMPIYRVAALQGDAAWLSDERHPSPALMPLAPFRWRGRTAD